MKRVLPPLVLLFLAPAVSQMLSAELAPASFFSPFGLTVLPLIYGGGAILVRDLVKRWRKGWVGLLLLGAVYGIVREGLMLRSFFDPFWQDIETLSYPGGKPSVKLYGKARSEAENLGIKEIAVSLAHSREYAIAAAIGSS